MKKEEGRKKKQEARRNKQKVDGESNRVDCGILSPKEKDNREQIEKYFPVKNNYEHKSAPYLSIAIISRV